MDIATNLTDLVNDLRKGRTNLIAKGVDVSNTAGFSEVMDKILEIQSTVSTGTVIDDSISLVKQVPANSISHCYISSLGGYTHVVPDENTELAPIRLENAKPTAIRVHGAQLIPYPYYNTTNTSKGITFTDNGDGTLTLNGTAESNVGFTFQLRHNFTLPKGTYTLSGFPSGLNASCYLIVTLWNNSTWAGELLDTGKGITKDISNLTYTGCQVGIHISAGTVCNNLVVKPMLNRGSVAVPYKPYRAPIEITLPESITSLPNLGLGIYDNEYNEIDFVNGKYYSRCGTKTFVGTESFTPSNLGSRKRFQIKAPTDERYWNGNRTSIFKSDYLNVDKIAVEINGNDTLKNYMLSFQGSWFFYVDGTLFPDLATWQAYLTEHPLEVVYELEHENTTDIDIGGFNPLIEVEGGGSIEFITDSGYAPNSTVVFQTI